MRASRRLTRVLPARRTIQWIAAILVLAIGVQFTFWVRAHLGGQQPTVSRPPGVEGFLPIDAMMSARHLLHTGEIDPIHPAGLGIFLGVCLMSLLLIRSFCSHICPVGLISEYLGRSGRRLGLAAPAPPRWLDIPLRGLKFLLLGFFGWAVWYAMSPAEVASFLESPYARIVDVKMWAFFAPPSRTTLIVLICLVVVSVLLRDFWCRYLCPYGALLGLVSLLAPFKVSRDEESCIGCQSCTKACPSRLPVHRLHRVRSIECIGCQDCVVACQVKSCLEVRPPGPIAGWVRLQPVQVTLLAAAVFFVTIGVFRLSGHWQTKITEAEYHHRIQELDSPDYSHAQGDAPTGSGR